MPVYQRETTIDAPLEEVWEFHVAGEGLEAVTPGFFNLRVEEIRGPDGEPGLMRLEAGAEVDVSVRLFDVGSRDTWTTIIDEFEESDEQARFIDRMEGGAFRHWVHTHSFASVFDDQTLMRDRIEYRFPYPPVGDLVGYFAAVGFEPMFRYRHWKTRKILES
jgi:ligand-binding SRPBCC domain-containing protein